ncbi:MAG: hypothetical protein V1797_20090 [Pseudomonadota bacterium]
MGGLRVILFDGGAGLCLYLRLPDGRRVLIDCGRRACAGALGYLREIGEITPQYPLTRLWRPLGEAPAAANWLAVLGLLRGLALRPGGAWVFWRSLPAEAPAFGLSARVIARRDLPRPPQAELFEPAVLVLGLGAEEVLELGGGPADWVDAACLALHWPRLPGGGGDLLVGADLPDPAWERLLDDGELGRLLMGVSCYCGRDQDDGEACLLSRGLVSAALPWLLLGALAGGEALKQACPGRQVLFTPAVGMLSIEAAENGVLSVQAGPRLDNPLAWTGLARPLDDAALPAPWPLRRALNG